MHRVNPPLQVSSPLSSTTMTSSTAFKTFSLANDIFEVSPQDEIYSFDVEANKRINNEAPWNKEYVGMNMLSERVIQ